MHWEIDLCTQKYICALNKCMLCTGKKYLCIAYMGHRKNGVEVYFLRVKLTQNGDSSPRGFSLWILWKEKS